MSEFAVNVVSKHSCESLHNFCLTYRVIFEASYTFQNLAPETGAINLMPVLECVSHCLPSDFYWRRFLESNRTLLYFCAGNLHK